MLSNARWSLRTLVMSGFAVATLALSGAIGYAIYSIEKLANDSEHLLVNAVYTTRLIDQLQEQIPDLQRTARQYQVVSSPELLDLYTRRHVRLLETVAALEAFPWMPETSALLPRLTGQAQLLALQLQDNPDSLEPDQYGRLMALAHQIHEESQHNMDLGLTSLRDDVTQLRHALITLAIMLVGVAMLFAAAFRRLVTRPVDQIGAGIRALGQANFDRRIEVRGPTDLVAIGQLLDWLRERLKDLEEQKLTFVRHMSHELKTPLANIREGAELLHDDLQSASTPELTELSDIVRKNSIRLQRLIDDLFDFAAWHDDRSRLYPETLNLVELLDEILQDYQLALRSRQITVQQKRPANCLLNGDRHRLRSLFDNLLSNALKYAPDGSDIRIDITDLGEVWQVHIQDEGPGIPPELRERVFLPFYQGQSPVHARIPGTGIGLSVAQAAAQAHGGELRVLDSQIGALFEVRLPQKVQINAPGGTQSLPHTAKDQKQLEAST